MPIPPRRPGGRSLLGALVAVTITSSLPVAGQSSLPSQVRRSALRRSTPRRATRPVGIVDASADGTDPIAVAESATLTLPPADDDGGPWTAADWLFDRSPVDFGGWVQLGWHSDSTDLFNTDPDRLNVQQVWLFAEKLAEPETGGFDWGYRFDALWGTDGGDTTSFGNPNGGWDAGRNFDTGDGYGFALPQAYLEVATGDFNVKAGHFFTLIGYEVGAAPGNFFYSHAMTTYNSEPFTHTGVLGSYAASEDTTVYGGWTLGWDTGFEQFGEGSNFLGGVSTALSDDVVLAYMTTIGDFGSRGRDAFMQSVVLDVALTDDLNYVAHSDLLRVGSTGEDTIGLNQYLFYNVDDALAVGARFEWWKADAMTGYAPHGGSLPASGGISYYAATFGANYKVNENIVVRPEFRYDWSEGADYNQGILGIDLIATF